MVQERDQDAISHCAIVEDVSINPETTVHNVEYSYNAISSVTVDLESVLIRFQGHELEVRIVSAYTQLIINQIYMRCLGKIEMKWGPSNNFPYKEPLITKLFILLNEPPSSEGEESQN